MLAKSKEDILEDYIDLLDVMRKRRGKHSSARADGAASGILKDLEAGDPKLGALVSGMDCDAGRLINELRKVKNHYKGVEMLPAPLLEVAKQYISDRCVAGVDDLRNLRK